MKEILVNHNVRLWVADNLASLAPGMDENSKQSYDPINQWLLELRFAGISTILLHHTGKGGDQRGTSAKEDNIDCSVYLRRPPDYSVEDGCKFVVSFRKSRVRTADAHLIADTQFQLTEDTDGKLVWTVGNPKRETRAEILRLINEGSRQKDVVDYLGVDKGYVSRVVKQATRDNLLTVKGKLTEHGWCQIRSEST